MCLIAESFSFSGGLAGMSMTKGQILPLWIPCGPPPLLISRAEVESRSTNTDSFKASLYSTWNIYIPCIYTYIHVYIYICMYIYLSPMFFTNKYSKSINPTYWIQQPIFLTWDGTKNTLSSLQQTFCKSKNANCKDSPSFIAQSWYTIAGWFICSL